MLALVCGSMALAMIDHPEDTRLTRMFSLFYGKQVSKDTKKIIGTISIVVGGVGLLPQIEANGCGYGLAAFSAACLYPMLPAGTDY
jgi:hypothetical protein